jgi:hypothetical protein
MDIIVRGGEDIADADDLVALRPDDETWIWRGQKPLQSQIGDRVYFVEEGCIYLYATYGGYDYRSSQNLQGNRQAGKAILLKAPVKPIYPPFRLNPPILQGPWRWRYDKWNLRQHI